MGNKLRNIPCPGTAVEVTDKTFQARHLLVPGPEANELIRGVFGRARELYPVDVICVTFMSNHMHLLLRVPDADTLAKFMGYLKGNLARELGRLHGWRGKFWARRYHAAILSDEEAAQVARFKYILSQGAKEGIVACPRHWPGVHSIDALLGDGLLRGTWYDRTRQYNAARRGKAFDAEAFAEKVVCPLSRLPCWEHLSDEEHRARIEDLLEQIREEAAAMRKAEGIVLRSRRKVVRSLLAVDPFSAPKRSKRSPAPSFHAATRSARRKLQEAYRAFVSAYRAAAEEYKRGNHRAAFPEGCFPPARSFIPLRPAP